MFIFAALIDFRHQLGSHLRRPYFRGPIPRPEQQRKHKINDEITATELRVIGEDGEAFGILSRRDALQKARDLDMDLVLIAPQAKPPVCKVIDYGKFMYEQVKREKDQKNRYISCMCLRLKLRARQ